MVGKTAAFQESISVVPCQLLDAVDQIKIAKEEAQEEAGRLAACNWLNIDFAFSA